MFEGPRLTDSVAPMDNYIQPNLEYGLRIWWAFYWRTFSSVFAAVVLNALLLRLQHNQVILFFVKYDVVIFYFLAAFFMMAYLLRKNFRSFRIGLLSNHGGQGAVPLAPTVQRTARVWWTFTWRAAIYRLVASVAAALPMGWIMGFLAAVFPDPAASALINFIVQIILDAAIGMFVIYSNILDEDISDFRVALLPRMTLTAPVASTTTSADIISG
jgi:hypothetical protein